MKHLKITVRLAISIVFLLIALAIMANAYIGSISQHVERARLELVGTTYMRPLMKVIAELADVQSLSQRLQAGDAQAEPLMQQQAADVTEAFKALENMQQRLETQLQLAPEQLHARGRDNLAFSSIMESWEAIAHAPAHATTEQFVGLSTALGKLVAHVSEVSGLMLDPEANSFYLMDATAVALVNTFTRLAEGTGEMYTAINGKAHDSQMAKARVLALATRLEQDYVKRIDDDFAISYTSTSANAFALQSHTQSHLARFDNDAGRLVGALYAVADGKFTQSPAELFAINIECRKSAYQLWMAGIEGLEGLLQQRMDDYTSQRDMAVLKALVAMVIAVGFFWYITSGITSSLKQIETAMIEVGNGNLEYKVPCLDLKDEIGNIAKTLELFRKSYWWLS